MLGKGDIVAPVGSVVLLLEMTGEPTMRVRLSPMSVATQAQEVLKTYSVQDVELTPFQRSRWSIGHIRHPGLDALDMAHMLYVVDGAVAAVARERARHGRHEGTGNAGLHLGVCAVRGSMAKVQT